MSTLAKFNQDNLTLTVKQLLDAAQSNWEQQPSNNQTMKLSCPLKCHSD